MPYGITQEQQWVKREAHLRREVSKACAAEEARRQARCQLECKLGMSFSHTPSSAGVGTHLHRLTCASVLTRLVCVNTELLEEVGTALLRLYDSGEGPSCTLYSSAVPEGPANAAEVCE